MESSVINSQSYLTFKLDNEIFGSSVNRVLEIIEVPKITRVPQAPEFMRGVINLRGRVLPVIDTRIKFGMPGIEDTVDTCIVVLNVEVDNQEIVLGALVDAIQAVLDIEDQEIQDPPAFQSGYRSDLITGMVKQDDNFILMLDMDKVFSSQEITILKESDTTIVEKPKEKTVTKKKNTEA
ncbi:MAG: chemotaxis protein CheW [Cyclobacteriaceae bacterium]